MPNGLINQINEILIKVPLGILEIIVYKRN